MDIEELASAVHQAFRHWSDYSREAGLLSFLSIIRREIEKQSDWSLNAVRLKTNEFLERAMVELEEDSQESMHLLRLRFHDKLKIPETADKLFISEYTVSHKQQKAIKEVATVLAAWEIRARQAKVATLMARLPLSSSPKLFGVKKPLAALVTDLTKTTSPWITAVVGIGGIGKTSLALAAVQQLVDQVRFEDVVWVELDPGSLRTSFSSSDSLRDKLLIAISKQLWPQDFGDVTPDQRLSKVRHALKTQHVLVVIDNLESDVDVAVLVKYLHDWCNPSKFLLTSRIRPQGVAYVQLNQLSRAASAKLVRYFLRWQNKAGAKSLAAADLDAIYEYTGGNPLALKLVVSLLDGLPLTAVLHGLVTINTDTVEELYRRIYWQNWQTISSASHTLLQAMVAVPREGANLSYLQVLSGLEERPLQSAILELRRRSLLDISDDLHSRQYTIHPLTKSFLQTEIIHWPLSANTDVGLEEE